MAHALLNLSSDGLLEWYAWLFTIYVGRPVDSRFVQMVYKIQDWENSLWNHI